MAISTYIPRQDGLSDEAQELLERVAAYMRREGLVPTDAELKNYARQQASTVSITFGEASRIDEFICGFTHNTHWMEAYNNPTEGQVIERDDETYTAEDCGIFTFKLM